MKGKKVMKIIGLILAALLIIGAIAAAIYCYKATHYWQDDLKTTFNAGFTEKQATTPKGDIINYAEGPDNGEPLLLIHGQTGAWEDYSGVLPELRKKYHVFAVDCYGHGSSAHNQDLYYLKENGDDLIWFTNNIIGEAAIVSGHSSGGLLAAYVAAYGGENIAAAMLEDPPVFSTEPDYFEKSFAYEDTYKNIHNYINSNQDECWEAYYMRHCLWGQLYMASSMDGLANYAQKYHEKHQDKPVQYFFMPQSINAMFLYTPEYDFQFGENFYNYTWHSGISHRDLFSQIKVPTVFLHTQETYSDTGILMAASSKEQAEKAVSLIPQSQLIEIKSNHNVHRFNSDIFLNAFHQLEDLRTQ